MIKFCFSKSQSWIRLFGRGIAVKNTNAYPLLFSERNGYTKHFQFGVFSIKYLPYAKKRGDRND